MVEPAVTYTFNRANQLAVAMVAAAAITMPRQEGSLRGSLENSSTGTSTRTPGELVTDVTTAAVNAAAGATRNDTVTETAIQHFALHICISVATAAVGQLAHAICPKRDWSAKDTTYDRKGLTAKPVEFDEMTSQYMKEKTQELTPIRYVGNAPLGMEMFKIFKIDDKAASASDEVKGVSEVKSFHSVLAPEQRRRSVVENFTPIETGAEISKMITSESLMDDAPNESKDAFEELQRVQETRRLETEAYLENIDDDCLQKDNRLHRLEGTLKTVLDAIGKHVNDDRPGTIPQLRTNPAQENMITHVNFRISTVYTLNLAVSRAMLSLIKPSQGNIMARVILRILILWTSKKVTNPSREHVIAYVILRILMLWTSKKVTNLPREHMIRNSCRQKVMLWKSRQRRRYVTRNGGNARSATSRTVESWSMSTAERGS